MLDRPVIAIVGGTGSLGSGLARLWAKAGYPIVIGSRSREKAEAVARELGYGGAAVTGDDNGGAARAGDVVVLAVPYASHDAIVDEIRPDVAGKIVVDATVPLVPPKVFVVQLPAAGSPAVAAQRALGPDARVVSAFHHVGAKKFQGGEKADCDVLVFGDDQAAREQVIALAGIVATRGVDGGVLANSVAAEALTSVLIAINRRYKIPGAGIRITGLPPLQEG
jgi:8-hydroxy-5-deazaflavin:NADPH oxidoreductase